MNQHSEKPISSGPPIFVVGCGHSGTSLLLAVLGAHSGIFAVPYESNIGLKSDAEAGTLFAEFDAAAIASGKRRWAEKTPSHIHCIEKILNWHPDGQILLIARDGRDVACSIRDRTGSVEGGIDRWVRDNLAGRPYWDHPSVHVLKYEDLVADFDSTVTRVMDFLGERFEIGMRAYNAKPLHFYSDIVKRPPTAFGKNHRQYRNWQINQPLFDGRGRWRSLSPEDLEMVLAKGGTLFREMGYAT